MKNYLRRLPSIALLSSFVFILSSIVTIPTAQAALREEWLPVTPAELALTTPKVEPDADAEVLFWDMRVQDRDGGSEYLTDTNNYVRVKVFNDRGKESQSKIEIVYANRTRINDIAGRTIKKDGTIVELTPEAVFDRTIVKYGNVKLNVKSFAMPAVEAGCIIEYRWKETSPTRIYQRLSVQRDLPVQRVTYHIKPLSNLNVGMRFKPFNCSVSALQKEGGGYYRTEVLDVKAFREEPHMPPEDFVRSWILLLYTEDNGQTPEKFWSDYGKRIYSNLKADYKVSDDVRRIATEVIAGATTDSEKIDRIHTFCRTKIKNLSDDALGLTDEDLKRIKDNRSANDTLKQMQGYGSDINVVFAAMCIAAGFETRPAAMSDRSDFLFDRSFTDSYFLQNIDIAVKVGTEWRIYDPASTYVSSGMLNWREENTQVLIADAKEPVWIRASLSGSAVSAENRTGSFTLSEDGTLEGDVRIEYTGHSGAEWKEFFDEDSQEKREASVLEAVRKRLSTAEITKIAVENVTDAVKPYTVSYHLKVPGFAQRTGKRLFFQPAFFQANVSPRFSAATRQHNIYFHYPWSEIDTVKITLPAGFELESADRPESLSVGKVGAYDVQISLSKDNSTILYERKLTFANDGSLFFDATNYPVVKKVFDAVHDRDGHTLTLRQKAAS